MKNKLQIRIRYYIYIFLCIIFWSLYISGLYIMWSDIEMDVYMKFIFTAFGLVGMLWFNMIFHDNFIENYTQQQCDIQDVIDSKNNIIKKGEIFSAKHTYKIKDFLIKQDDKIEIIEVYKKTADIKINNKLLTDVKFDDIGEIKYLLYKDCE